ncbi:TerD family protein [Streptomyces sp. NPDC097619]|uniref:TerD family protein n=1 Tax=Streptomyces sp. NPDC097619 TaxID=3157228 RepID=UPI003326B8C8
MTGIRKGLTKAEVALRWDPSPAGAPPHDLDLVAAAYAAEDPHGTPVYLVHHGRRAPDGTVTLDRDSRTGQGFGFDEVLILELGRMEPRLVRVVVGAVVQDGGEAKTFAEVPGTAFRVREGHTDLAADGFTAVAGASAATVAEFRREGGVWSFHPGLRGYTAGLDEFTALMGEAPSGTPGS